MSHNHVTGEVAPALAPDVRLSQHRIDRGTAVCYACEHGDHDTAYTDAVHRVAACACGCNKEGK